MQEIDVEQFFGLIESQKARALESPIYIFSNSDMEKDALETALEPFTTVYGNRALFLINDVSSYENVLLEAVHRTAVFYFYRSDSIYQQQWFTESVMPQFQDNPIIDVYGINTRLNDKGATQRLSAVGVSAVPCVLVYRMGHQVDRILPEQENLALKEQVEEFKQWNIARSKMRQECSIEQMARERDEFDSRYFRQRAEEQEKERMLERRHRLAVLQRIQQDKEERQQKH